MLQSALSHLASSGDSNLVLLPVDQLQLLLVIGPVPTLLLINVHIWIFCCYNGLGFWLKGVNGCEKLLLAMFALTSQSLLFVFLEPILLNLWNLLACFCISNVKNHLGPIKHKFGPFQTQCSFLSDGLSAVTAALCCTEQSAGLMCAMEPSHQHHKNPYTLRVVNRPWTTRSVDRSLAGFCSLNVESSWIYTMNLKFNQYFFSQLDKQKCVRIKNTEPCWLSSQGQSARPCGGIALIGQCSQSPTDDIRRRVLRVQCLCVSGLRWSAAVVRLCAESFCELKGRGWPRRKYDCPVGKKTT